MIKLLIKFKINLIKVYKYVFSPFLGSNCRYITTCSDYYIDSLRRYGLTKGSYLGIKRILTCHPVKILGGGSGLDFSATKSEIKKENFNG